MKSPSPEQPAKPMGGGLAAFASLLDPDAKPEIGTISRAPVVYGQPAGKDTAKEQSKDGVSGAAFRFQPTKRPQQHTQAKKPRATPATAKTGVQTNASSEPASDAQSATTAAAPMGQRPKTTLADWAADDDDNYYVGEKRPRGGRKKRKKNQEAAPVILNWDDIYDPSQPNNYADYKHSEEKYREIRDWKDKLHAHEIRKGRAAGRALSENEDRAGNARNRGFAPPSNYNFAPPAMYDDDQKPPASSPPKRVPSSPPPPPLQPPANVPDDPTGDDAYARRLALSTAPSQPHPLSEPNNVSTSQSSPPLQSEEPRARFQPTGATISRAPILNALPTADPNIHSSEAELEASLAAPPYPPANAEDGAAADAGTPADAPRSLRPGQKGFAERLLSKYGWSKGSGLGATGTGIATPLSVQLDKRKKKSDAAGGGFAGPAGKGRIVGGKLSKAAEAEQAEKEEREGKMSEVVVLSGLCRGMDLEEERSSGGLVQEIGEECGGKYGMVERVFIHWDWGSGPEMETEERDKGPPVFVKFTSALSALRAVNALEGRAFGGNIVSARFYNAEAFETGVYG